MYDVVVIGAGIAGLACARQLHDAGAAVVVVEARDRIGGRVRTHTFGDGDRVELGAMFVHGERASIVGVIEDAGLGFERTREPAGRAETVLVPGGRSVRTDVAVDRTAFWAMERLVADLDAPDVLVPDALRAAGWSEARIRGATEFFEQIWCADPDRLSAQGVARVERSWTSGQTNLVVAGGYSRLADHLADGLDVELNHPVSDVRWSEGRTTVETGGRRAFEATAVVVTVPPPLVASGQLRFDPELPVQKQAAVAAIPIGALHRAAVRLQHPAPMGVFAFVDGGGWWTAREGSHVLTGWTGGPRAARLSGKPVRELIAPLTEAVSWMTDDLVEDAVVADWTVDPYSLGGYSYPAVGALDAPDVWAAPVGQTIFFAGEATCGDVHPATVHGAYDSGVRAAGEVSGALGASTQGRAAT